MKKWLFFLLLGMMVSFSGFLDYQTPVQYAKDS
jgi:hypothetical protein